MAMLWPFAKQNIIQTYRRVALGMCDRYMRATGKYIISLFFLMWLVCWQQGHAQVTSAPAANKIQPKALAIGDKIPDDLWNLPIRVVNHPQGKETITLADYKGKLIILDFWATWCVPCIKAFPELQELSKEFKEELQFVLATHEERAKINDFLKKRKIFLTSIVDDNTLNIVFPKNSVPHEIWIKDGKVFAITDTYFINSKTINKVLTGELTSLTEKKFNNTYNLNEPLLINDNGGNANNLLYHSVISGYLDGIGGAGVSTDTLGRYKLRALNGTAFQLYTFASRRIDFTLTKNRIVNNTSIKEKLLNLNPANVADRPNFFCYELILPKAIEANAPYLMIDDLNRLFAPLYHMRGEFSKVMTKCWVLRKYGQDFTGKTKGGKATIIKQDDVLQFINQPFSDYFISLAKANEDQPFPFVDKTAINEKIDMKIPYQTPDMETTKELLKSYGLYLTLEECEIEMLILTDIKNNTNP